MFRTLLLGVSLATTLGFAAHAQTMPAPDQNTAPPPTADEAGAPASANAASGARAGMTVTDSSGATIGKITQVGQTADGQSAVVIDVDGKPFTVAANTLSPSGAGMVSSMTKAQIKAAPKASE